MHPPTYDLLGIGNAIVDIVSPADHAFLSKHDMHPGSMALIDQTRADTLTAAMPPGQETSGGSAANTCAVAAGLGARVAFLGKVADDKLGHAFAHDLGRIGVHFPSTPLPGGAPTARCLILVTPDGQRTMNTYLGACIAFGEHDVDTDLVANAAITYLEGYLFDPPAAQSAFRLAARTARQAGRKVALSLSDAFCVNRHRAAFTELLGDIDVLFANEVEICALFEVNDFAAAVEAVRNLVPLAALTQGEDGSTIIHNADLIRIAAEPTKLVDSTGAGDAYAAGFLAAYTAGRSLEICGRAGAMAASEVISHYGARPERGMELPV